MNSRQHNKKIVVFDKNELNEQLKKNCDKELDISELIEKLNKEGRPKSIRQLARMTDLSPVAIQKIKSGKTKDVRLKNFINIAKVYGYEVVLVKGEESILLKNKII
ncbi:helix-turn-helix domain-containing protein [Fulvivirgaceae bacterium BMA10]|uniref:Helix-turn-helix domain-containing protein n=1 Tax=Splendidivirga corallicola TaxID=3051826 RepID=A0ABT8KTW2_9BACT|nr:helix-turn-helix domain-containing protein [Fulvivirgaceae bacterium BMA10]